MLLDRLRRLRGQKQAPGGNHRRVVIDHLEIARRALAGEKEYLHRLAQLRQTSPMGHDPSQPIPAKAEDNG